MTKLEKERHKQLVNFRDIENKKLEQRSDFSTLDYYFGIRGTRVIEIKKVINRIWSHYFDKNEENDIYDYYGRNVKDNCNNIYINDINHGESDNYFSNYFSYGTSTLSNTNNFNKDNFISEKSHVSKNFELSEIPKKKEGLLFEINKL